MLMNNNVMKLYNCMTIDSLNVDNMGKKNTKVIRIYV